MCAARSECFGAEERPAASHDGGQRTWVSAKPLWLLLRNAFCGTPSNIRRAEQQMGMWEYIWQPTLPRQPTNTASAPPVPNYVDHAFHLVSLRFFSTDVAVVRDALFLVCTGRAAAVAKPDSLLPAAVGACLLASPDMQI